MIDLKDPSLWEETEHDFAVSENISRKSLTFTQDVWRRFKENKLAMASLMFIAVLMAVALFTPMVWPYSYSDQNLNYSNVPFRLALYETESGDTFFVTNEYNILMADKRGVLGEPAACTYSDVMKRVKVFDVAGREIEINYSEYFKAKKKLSLLERQAARGKDVDVAACESEIKNMPRYTVYEEGRKLAPSLYVRNRKYILGNDALGRDLFIRIVYGARISLTVGFAAAIVCFAIGVLYGGLSGYIGGRTDSIMMRIVDIVNTIPMLLYVILLRVLFNSGSMYTIILTIGLTYWVTEARIVRGLVLSLKEQEFVLAAKSLGGTASYILLRHLVPNIMGPVMVSMTMQIPNAIFAEAFLSFVGLGVSAPAASWGTLCNDALEGLYTFPHQLLFPALAISATILAFSLLGDGLRDALDPRLRK